MYCKFKNSIKYYREKTKKITHFLNRHGLGGSVAQTKIRPKPEGGEQKEESGSWEIH